MEQSRRNNFQQKSKPKFLQIVNAGQNWGSVVVVGKSEDPS